MNKKRNILVCKHCAIKMWLTRHWRRDVQAHYNAIHKTDKKYLSAFRIVQNHFRIIKADDEHGIN